MSFSNASHRANRVCVRAVVISSEKELAELSEDWQTLLEESDANTIFLTLEWILTWLQKTASTSRLFVIAVYRNNQLIGIAPFYISSLRMFKYFSFNCLRITADQNTSSEYQDLIIHRDFHDLAISKIIEVLKDNQDLFSFIWIPYTDVAQGASRRLEVLFKGLGFSFASRLFSYHSIDLPDSKIEFDKCLNSKQRNNIRRYTKKLGADSEVKLVNLADIQSADEAFTVMRSLHEIRWQAAGESGAFQRKPEFSKFLKAFSQIAIKRGWLAALCLFKNGEPIAIRYGFVYNKKIYEIQAGFLPTVNGSGIVAIDKAIEYAIAHNLEEYDFLAYGGEYKSRFNANAREGRHYFAAKPNLFTRLIFQLGVWPTGRYIQMI